MSKLCLIPDRTDMERISALADSYGCMFEYNDFFNPLMLDDPTGQEETIGYYRRYRQSFGQDTIHGAFLDVTIHSSDPLMRDASMLRIRQSMEIAKRMGVWGVVFHTGRIAHFLEPHYLNTWQESNAMFFTRIAEEYPDQQIYMENMFDEAPDILAKFAEQMKPVKNFGICLDYAHAVISGSPVREWVEVLAPYIRHIHINDNDLKHDMHQPIGSGSIDWAEYNDLMHEYKIDASVLVEVNGYEAQEKSLRFMQQHGIYPMEKRER